MKNKGAAAHARIPRANSIFIINKITYDRTRRACIHARQLIRSISISRLFWSVSFAVYIHLYTYHAEAFSRRRAARETEKDGGLLYPRGEEREGEKKEARARANRLTACVHPVLALSLSFSRSLGICYLMETGLAASQESESAAAPERKRERRKVDIGACRCACVYIHARVCVCGMEKRAWNGRRGEFFLRLPPRVRAARFDFHRTERIERERCFEKSIGFALYAERRVIY